MSSLICAHLRDIGDLLSQPAVHECADCECGSEGCPAPQRSPVDVHVWKSRRASVRYTFGFCAVGAFSVRISSFAPSSDPIKGLLPDPTARHSPRGPRFRRTVPRGTGWRREPSTRFGACTVAACCRDPGWQVAPLRRGLKPGKRQKPGTDLEFVRGPGERYPGRPLSR